MATLRVRVISPERMVYTGDASALVAPAWDGQVGILPGHAPMIVLLAGVQEGDRLAAEGVSGRMGRLTIDRLGGGAEEYQVAGGVLKVEANQVTVLTEYADREAGPGGLPARRVRRR